MITRRAIRRTATLGVALVASLGLAACGGDGSSGGAYSPERGGTTAAAPGGDGQGILISADADGALAFDQSAVSAPAGKLELTFENPSEVVHDVVIEQDGAELAATDRVTSGSTTEVVELEPGDYVFYCSITGHRPAGMEGTLSVE